LGDSAFNNCTSLATATLGKGVSSVPRGVFGGCRRLTIVTIPESTKSIQEGAFTGCANLSNVVIPNGVTYIGDYAFAGCKSLTNVIIPNSVIVVLPEAFLNCTNLANVTISSGITGLMGGTFQTCANLRSVTISDNVQTIWDTDFGACTNLLAMYFQGNAPTLHQDPDAAGWGLMVLSNNPSLVVYYLPGTSGWGPTFGGRPTAIWRPQIRANDSAFVVQRNQFRFNVRWSSGMTVVIDACTSLANPIWHPLQTNLLTGDSWCFSDPGWTNYPARYYRVRSP
jgi:BspA type Leucine rich repeat region (6 copies)